MAGEFCEKSDQVGYTSFNKYVVICRNINKITIDDNFDDSISVIFLQLDGAGSGGGNNGVCIAGCRRDTNCPFGQVCVDVGSPGGTRVEKVIVFSKLK